MILEPVGLSDYTITDKQWVYRVVTTHIFD